MTALIITACGPSCFLTSQSFNHGKLLNPGEGLVTYGYGNSYGHKISREQYDQSYFDPDYDLYLETDSVDITFRTHSFDYRLGFLSKYPFGKGAEIGLHSEITMFRDKEGALHSTHPPILEFSLRCGFPELQFLGGLYHHNIDLGWVVGSWVDNGWFGGYAAGVEYTRLIPYAGAWMALSATDPSEGDPFDDESSFFKDHDRTWHLKLCAGVSVKVKRIPVFPDYVSPEITIIQPLSSDEKRTGFTWQIGLRWLNGI